MTRPVRGLGVNSVDLRGIRSPPAATDGDGVDRRGVEQHRGAIGGAGRGDRSGARRARSRPSRRRRPAPTRPRPARGAARSRPGRARPRSARPAAPRRRRAGVGRGEQPQRAAVAADEQERVPAGVGRARPAPTSRSWPSRSCTANAPADRGGEVRGVLTRAAPGGSRAPPARTRELSTRNVSPKSHGPAPRPAACGLGLPLQVGRVPVVPVGDHRRPGEQVGGDRGELVGVGQRPEPVPQPVGQLDVEQRARCEDTPATASVAAPPPSYSRKIGSRSASTAVYSARRSETGPAMVFSCGSTIPSSGGLSASAPSRPRWVCAADACS